jgi:hypothetical protein
MNKNTNYTTTKVVNGKRIPSPPPKKVSLTNADFFRASDYGIYALQQKKNEFVNFNIKYNKQNPRTLSKKQITYLTNLYEAANTYLKKNPLLIPTAHQITKSLRQKTKQLGITNEIYKVDLPSLNLPSDLENACKKLIEFMLELVETFTFIDNLISDIQKIPNRPSDLALRKLVLEIILDYQKTKNTDKFPTHPYVLKQLNSTRNNQSKFQLSARQYGNYKLWIKRDTYHWYIQP